MQSRDPFFCSRNPFLRHRTAARRRPAYFTFLSPSIFLLSHQNVVKRGAGIDVEDISVHVHVVRHVHSHQRVAPLRVPVITKPRFFATCVHYLKEKRHQGESKGGQRRGCWKCEQVKRRGHAGDGGVELWARQVVGRKGLFLHRQRCIPRILCL